MYLLCSLFALIVICGNSCNQQILQYYLGRTQAFQDHTLDMVLAGRKQMKSE